MAKVFVSSTFLDLQECRRQVSLVLRRMRHEDVAMEYYVAEDRRPVEKCLADVAACDLYIGIFAWRYGWVPPTKNPKKRSITEMEYRQAVKSKKHCLIFLLHEDASWPVKLIDKDRDPIDNLRAELGKRNVSHFKTADNIGSVVGPAVHNWEKEHGFVSSVPVVPQLNLAAYYKALVKRYQRLDLDALTPPQKEEYLQLQLRSVFVEQTVREDPPPIELPKEIWERLEREKEIHLDELPDGFTPEDALRARTAYHEKPSRPALNALTDSSHQRSIVLGDPGSGKSTLARYVLLSLIDDAGDEKLNRAFKGFLPLLIELRSYAGLCESGKCDSFLEFLEYLGNAEGWSLDKGALHHYLKSDGRAVVIFDGLDEIFDPADRERITRRITGFASDYPKARIIVTSRIIGYGRRILTDAGFAHFTLQDLNEEQALAFVNQWYGLALSDRPDEAEDRRDRIMRSFRESAPIRQLAGNPMLLTIMAIIGKHQELPRERWKLYDHAASVLVQHWDVNKHLKDLRVDAGFIGEDDKKELLRRLAYRMQGGEGGLRGNYIHGDHLREEFEDYLKTRYDLPTERAAVVARAMIEQFRERNFILSLYGANLYGFVHRAFLEHFCATAFVHRFEKTQKITIEELKRDVYGAHWEDRNWHEVLRLICGMIDEKFVGEIIDYLTSEVYPDWPDNFQKRLPWHIALAVQCLSEVRNLGTVAEPAGRLLKTVCSLFSICDEPDISDRKNLDNFLKEQIAPAAKVIGPDWPHRTMLADWLWGFKRNSISWIYVEAFGNLVGSIGAESDRIHQAILDCTKRADPLSRVLASSALAKGWRDDPQTLQLIRDHAVNSESSIDRSTAVRSLGQHFRDDSGTLPLLQALAIKDSNESGRSAAIWALGEYFRDDSQTLLILQGHAVNDESELVRSTAIWVLSEHFHDDPDTIPLLHSRAVEDTNEYVRRTAVEALGQHFRDDPGTLPLLQDRSIEDDDDDVRSTAVETLGQHFRDDPSTLPLLREWAINSQHSDVRSTAVEALSQHFRDDPSTLFLLQDRAVNDESPSTDDSPFFSYAREVAIEALAKYWPAHPDTLPLLRERAQNDPTEWLRDKARQLAYKLESGN